MKKVDAYRVWCEMDRDDNGTIQGDRSLDLARDVLPADYEPEKYEISGSYSIKLVIKKK